MKILLIGNGFDLAHDLPTRYSNFLDFVNEYIWHSKSGDGVQHEEYCLYFDSLLEQYPVVYKEYGDLIDGNRLLKYFLGIYSDRCENGKDGWIDFENEIAIIVKNLESAQEQFIEQSEEGNEVIAFRPRSVDMIVQTLLLVGEDGKGYGHNIPDSFKDGRVDGILNDLNRLTRLLEMYLVEYVETREVRKRLPEFENSSIDRVISFNYTDTYRKLYDKNGNAEYCFIHGKARGNADVYSCDLVLGINEEQRYNSQLFNNSFVWFKKFYQRIYKETDSEYVDWMEAYEQALQAMPKSKIPGNDLYIYGHSLDVTDKDVLESLILAPKMTTHIYYYCKKDLSDKIRNLVAIIGQLELIKRTRGKRRSIIFTKSGVSDSLQEGDDKDSEVERLLR